LTSKNPREVATSGRRKPDVKRNPGHRTDSRSTSPTAQVVGRHERPTSRARRVNGRRDGGRTLRRTSGSGATKGLEGERKPKEGQGRRSVSQGIAGEPDPPAEQSLEAELCGVRTRSLAPFTRCDGGDPNTLCGSGSGTGNGKGATIARRREIACRWGEFFEGSFASRGSSRRPPAREVGGSGNAANPRVGSGMQQARGRVAEQTVEVVRNHEGGSRGRAGRPITEDRRESVGFADAARDVDGGVTRDEPQGRRLESAREREGRPGRSESLRRRGERPRRPGPRSSDAPGRGGSRKP